MLESLITQVKAASSLVSEGTVEQEYLRPAEDAYGQLMLAAFEGRRSFEVLERDDGLITVPLSPTTDTSVAAESYLSSDADAWTPTLRSLLPYGRGRILDIGSGAGRIPLWWQSQGLDVVATDVSPLAVEICRRRGLRAYVASVHEVDPELGPFDTIALIDSFGAVGSADGLRRALSSWLEIASEDARIIAEPLNPHLTEDPDHLAYYARNRAQGRLPGQLRMRVRYRRYCTPWFDWLLISPGEVEQVVADSGWEIEHLFTDEDAGARYGLVLRRA